MIDFFRLSLISFEVFRVVNIPLMLALSVEKICFIVVRDSKAVNNLVIIPLIGISTASRYFRLY